MRMFVVMLVSRKFLSALVLTNLATLAGLFALLLCGFTGQRNHFEKLTAERIDIVGANGKPVIAISNKDRIAGPVVGGKTYPASVSEGRELMAGMIFFNQDGDEMGGLVFNSFKMPNGRTAGIGHLSFDRFNDNQVLNLEYKENAQTVQSGLTLYDRPANGKFKESLDLIHEAKTASPERMAEIKKAFSAFHEGRQHGGECLFVGSKNEEPQLLLPDSKSRIRVRLRIDKEDRGQLEFLDEAGKVVDQLPR